jgi:hypothetical protein
MRAPVGIDVNGWADAACRDWDPGDPDVPPAAPHAVDGGICPVVVVHAGMHVGGPQAALSPIGRGAGWGAIGDTANRRDIAKLWQAMLLGRAESHDARDLCEAMSALSMFSDHRTICIPDRIEMDEERQRQLLQALQGQRQPTARLLWRSVAILLGMLDDGMLDVSEGSRVACLVHESDGILLQTFTLRSLAEHPGWLAPERAGPGRVMATTWSLDALLAAAQSATHAVNPHLAAWGTEQPRMPAEFLFAAEPPSAPEIVRRDNGNWARVVPPDRLAWPDPAALDALTIDAQTVVLWSPLAKRHVAPLADALQDRLGKVPILADKAAAARGALRAARRIERDIPHYLDRLDPVALAVARRDGTAAFDDLIGPDAIVRGNREYVSQPIERLGWPAGMDRAEFYIRKGTHQIRRWIVDSVRPPSQAEALIAELRQTPAQGWARLSIRSTQWDELRNRPIVLDWNRLENVDESEEELLARLARPRPIVPERVRLLPHLGLWDGSMRAPGLATALRTFHSATRPDMHRLSESLRNGFRDLTVGQALPFYAVGSDGDLPNGLDPRTSRQLDAAIELAWQRLRAALRGQRLTDNGALMVLTWAFGRCPREAKQELLRAAVCRAAGRPHPFLAPLGAHTVVVQGLGRVISDAELLREAIPLAASQIANTNFLAALAALVSRPSSSPLVLHHIESNQVMQRLSERVGEFEKTKQFNIGFRHALTAIVGVLRLREHEPQAFVADTSPLAGSLRSNLMRATDVIRLNPGRTRSAAALLAVLPHIIEILGGYGGRPDILEVLESIEE